MIVWDFDDEVCECCHEMRATEEAWMAPGTLGYVCHACSEALRFQHEQDRMWRAYDRSRALETALVLARCTVTVAGEAVTR